MQWATNVPGADVTEPLREASDFEKDGTEPVGPVLRRLLTRSGLLGLSDREQVWAVWQRILRADADHTRLDSLRNHTATFVVDSSVLLAELRGFRKQEILEAIQRDVKTYFVRDIRFRLEKPSGGPQRRQT